MGIAQAARMLDYAVEDLHAQAWGFTARHLIEANFKRERAIFRERFDAHVKAWERAVQSETYSRYFTDETFSGIYDDFVADQQREADAFFARVPFGLGVIEGGRP